ncbi:MAG: haloacid dehalogenase type II, partial [Nocardioides sp.]
VQRPELIVLDVNETLSDLAGVGEAFGEVGLDDSAVDAWFAGVLRDAFALTVLGVNPSFAEIGSASLRVRLAAAGAKDPASGAQRVMERFSQLRPHPDVVPGLLALAGAGCRIVTLSNGSAAVARALLEDTAAGAVIEDYLSVADAGVWKPAARAYQHALEQTSVAAADAMLVAVHPWDIEGARRAGLRSAWISRGGVAYPDHFGAADVEAASLTELADELGSR